MARTISEPLIWQVPEVAVRVELDSNAIESFLARAGTDTEVYGILLGEFGDEDGIPVARATAVAPLEGGVGAGARRLRPGGRLAPVGLIRTHLRRGLYLDQRDFGFFREHFTPPHGVFLLVRPVRGGAGAAGCFVWEANGDMQRHRSYLELPMRWPAAVSGSTSRLRGLPWWIAASALLPVLAYHAARLVALRDGAGSALP